jgi:shikimate kinase
MRARTLPFPFAAALSTLRGVSSTRTNLVLIGFMGSGKTSIGRLVAQRLGFQFVDTDAVIVERAGMQVAEIFERHGEAWFRAEETAVLRSLSILNRAVISTGGGIVTRPENHALLRELGLVVWLTASEEVIFERVSRNQRRPLLQTADPRATVHELLAKRRPLYEAVAHFTLETTTQPHETAADALIAEARRVFAWEAAP